MKPILAAIGRSASLACLTLSAQETQPARGGGVADRFRQRDRNGWTVFFTREDAEGTRQRWRAPPAGARYEARQLTTLPGGAGGGLYTRNPADPDRGVIERTAFPTLGKGSPERFQCLERRFRSFRVTGRLGMRIRA